MRRLRATPLIVLFGLLAISACGARGGLSGYLEGDRESFSWSKKGESTVGNVKVVSLRMRSQTWRGIPWDHSLQLFLPEKMTHPKTAFMLVTGGNPGLADTSLGLSASGMIEAPLVVLYNIPNQPLFGMNEDDLIAHTFQEYLNSGDESWPLLFPMTKSAIRAMDALQEYSRRELKTPIEDFVVGGASKRGWTTYLTGASDPRVRAIAPMVFDNLRFKAQMPRQLALWGKYSEQIEDYTRRGLQQKMETERGKRLTSLVDPWFYRERLKMPKLLIHGANDRYWATDATLQYWKDLPGRKHLLNVPNAGHGLDDRQRVLSTLAAFFHAVAADRELPKLDFDYDEDNKVIRVELKSSEEPKEVRLWTSRAQDLDFRPLKWESTAVAKSGRGYEVRVDNPRSGGLALFAEAEYEHEGRRFTLSTPSAVFGRRPEEPSLK